MTKIPSELLAEMLQGFIGRTIVDTEVLETVTRYLKTLRETNCHGIWMMIDGEQLPVSIKEDPFITNNGDGSLSLEFRLLEDEACKRYSIEEMLTSRSEILRKLGRQRQNAQISIELTVR